IVKYPSPNWKKTGTTGKAFLTNHKPDPHVRRILLVTTTLAAPPNIYCSSFVI
uniref:Ovule protein n=1 Tax=Mesocestoides corti TaxID=53468 RepID=A0A5K3FZI4_MESCO